MWTVTSSARFYLNINFSMFLLLKIIMVPLSEIKVDKKDQFDQAEARIMIAIKL